MIKQLFTATVFATTVLGVSLTTMSASSAETDVACVPAPGIDCPSVDNPNEVTSPRDAASGLPTGKRQHKPMTITKELDKSSPTLEQPITSNDAEAPPNAPPVSGVAPETPDSGSAMIECPSGTVPSGSAGCVPITPTTDDMAINEKGLPGGKPPKDVKK